MWIFQAWLSKIFKLKIFENPQYSNRSQTEFFIDKKDFLQIFAIVKILEEFRWSPIHSKRVKNLCPVLYLKHFISNWSPSFILIRFWFFLHVQNYHFSS